MLVSELITALEKQLDRGDAEVMIEVSRDRWASQIEAVAPVEGTAVREGQVMIYGYLGAK